MDQWETGSDSSQMAIKLEPEEEEEKPNQEFNQLN